MACDSWQIVTAHTCALQRYAQIIELERMAGKTHAEACYTAMAAAETQFILELDELLGKGDT